jgi:SAM-dependent methyltransferase
LNKRIKSLLKSLIPKKIRTALAWSMHSTTQASNYWENFQIVREIYQERITGNPSLSWYTWKVRERSGPFGRVLAFGDGKGMAAEAALARNDTHEVVYFNISKGECRSFERLFSELHFEFPYRCVIGDANRFDFTRLGTFDTIISVGSFHHFENFERIFSRLNQILKSDGLLYADEFIGPSQWRYEGRIIELINQYLNTLPEDLLLSRKTVIGEEFYKLWKNGLDPSESIRSGELDQWLRKSFIVLETYPFNGTFLYPFFLTAQFNPQRLNIPSWHDTDIGQDELKKMALQEDEWITSGRLPPHFMYYTMGKK